MSLVSLINVNVSYVTLLVHSLRLRFIHVNGLRCVWKQAVQRKLKWLLSARGLLSTWRQYFIITSKKQSRTWKHSQYNRIVETLKGEGALCYLGHWTKQKWLRFVLLRFFFLFRIRKEEIRCVGEWGGGRNAALFIFFSFSLPVPQTHVGRCRRGGWGRGWSTPLPDSDNC